MAEEMREFVPEEHGLKKNGLNAGLTGPKKPKLDVVLGIGLDSCMVATRHKGIHLVQTTDFFYPLVDDPYVQGKIACANVLSDLYAMGVSECDNMLMLLGVCTDLTAKEREVVTKLIIQGFSDLAREAGTTVNGGQTVLNPWYIIGGVASSVVTENEVILPENAVAGDVIVLTKPLGTQIAVNAHQWIEQPEMWKKIEHTVSVSEVKTAYKKAMHSMACLNKNAAKLMHKYNAHCSTDVTGFGILGHAMNLVLNQKEKVSFLINKLPILANMTAVYKACGINFKLLEGYSAETSGGLLVCMAPSDAVEYCNELENIDGNKAWIIGEVIQGEREAKLSENFEIIEV
eukprot:gene2143-17730_t